MEDSHRGVTEEENWRLHSDPDLLRRQRHIAMRINNNHEELVTLKLLYQQVEGKIQDKAGKGYLGDE